MDGLVTSLHCGGAGLPVVTGVPVAPGLLPCNASLCAVQGGDRLPLWWDIRSRHPDGSVRWLFLHLQPAAAGPVYLVAGPGGRPAGEAQVAAKAGGLKAGELAATWNAGGFEVRAGGGRVALLLDATRLGTGLSAAERFEAEMLEASAVAPLMRLWAEDALCRVEYLLRLYPGFGAARLQRRLTLLGTGRAEPPGTNVDLVETRIELECRHMGNAAGRVRSLGFEDVLLEGCARAENTDAVLAGGPGRGGIALRQATRRFPCEAAIDGGRAVLRLWAGEAASLAAGISLRHTIDVWFGQPPAAPAFAFAPGYLAESGCFGPCYVQGQDPDRLDFPGFEHAYRRLLEMGRAEQAGGDPMAYGLLNDGDWPLGPGQYAAEGRRCYADNEYDTAFAYFQGYAAFGDTAYLELARRCAVHMADIDCCALDGDMYYHGYGDTAEDHRVRRSKGELGHYWADGLWLCWLMFGDVWSRQAARALTAHVVSSFGAGDGPLRNAWAVCERNLGWPLVVAVAAAENDGDETAARFAARVAGYVDRYTRDPDAEYTAGGPGRPVWWRAAMQDGCKPFMLGVVMEGLERLHRLNGSQPARDGLLRLADYLCRVAYRPICEDFTYEINAFGSAHRGINAQQLTPLFLRGLAYAAECGGRREWRDIALKAFHACLWTLYTPEVNGKDVALLGRSLSAFVVAAQRWLRGREAAELAQAARRPSTGMAGSWRAGMPESGLNFYSDAGRAEFAVRFAAGSTDALNQRCLLHLCGAAHNQSAVSVVTFYRRLAVRFYDGHRRLVGALETALDSCVPGGWGEGEWHTVRVEWQAPGCARLFVNGTEAAQATLDRPLGGGIAHVTPGRKPGNWTLKGDIRMEGLSFGPKKA